MRDIVYLNGSFVPRSDALLSIEDRGFQFGDGVYEVTRFYGRRALRLDAHLARLEASTGHMKIVGAPTANEWKTIIDRLMDECEIGSDDPTDYSVYQQVTRGVVARNHFFPATPVAPTCLASIGKIKVQPQELRHEGVELLTQDDERWNRCYIKSTCLLPVVLAKQAAADAGKFEALLVRDGVVTEGGSTNLSCVIDGAVHTHPEGQHILSGITRSLMMEAAAKAGVPVVERPVPIGEFLGAAETFLCSTTLDIMPVTRVDGQAIGNGSVGPVTMKLMQTLAAMIHEETGRPLFLA